MSRRGDRERERERRQPAAAAASNGRQSAMDQRSSFDRTDDVVIQRPAPVADIPPRCDTAFSEAQTLQGEGSSRSRSSIAKPPLDTQMTAPQENSQEAGLRSMFPQFNPSLPVDRQDYYPTQASPTHIPRGVISRPLYSPNEEGETQSVRSPHGQRPVHSPPFERPQFPQASSSNPNRPFVPRGVEAPTIPAISSLEELRGLWKVANGWKAAAAEGRVYCLKFAGEKDTPIYTLSSDNQTPFYHFRIEPTSASAYVTVTRHDPTKQYRGQAPEAVAVSPGGTPSRPENKNWQEALTTTLEEESRKLPPNDGLVSLLYPHAAAKRALDAPFDDTAVLAAERECARLVWDADSESHYLVHPALALPFCVTVERNPTWSRTEYTLEHLESPAHIARLTRDGTGEGWLEIDTGIAAKIGALYIVDVAVSALVLVAHSDAAFKTVEVFEPPPSMSFAGPPGTDGRGERGSILGGKLKGKKEKKPPKSRMEEFEMDVESQTSEMEAKAKRRRAKNKEKKEEEDDLAGLPGPVRILAKIFIGTFKCFIWIATMFFKALAAMVRGLMKCLGL
jgi:hypothetical protein